MQATHLAGAVIALKGLGGILFVLNSNVGALLLVSITFFWIYDHLRFFMIALVSKLVVIVYS